MRKTLAKISLLLLINFAFSQEVDISGYLYLLRMGNIEAVKDSLDSLRRFYPNSVNLKYLEAVLSRDGEQAIRLYNDIVLNHSDNDYADDALFKISQFYYAKGDYERAKIEFEKLRTLYPLSPYAGMRIRFPTTGGFSNELVKGPTGVDCKYSLQVGSFLDRKNAEREREFFESKGYQVRIYTKLRDGKLYYAVWVGCFRDRVEANLVKELIKREFGRDSFIISTSEMQ